MEEPVPIYLREKKPLSAYRHLSPYRERLVKKCHLIAIAALLSGIGDDGRACPDLSSGGKPLSAYRHLSP